MWHAAVQPPRAGLPTVTIDLGYRGPYVPPVNSPITLRATAANVPFDGYIGFRFVVKDKQTLDTPVVARAVLRPGESWSFHTMATLRRWGGSRDRAVLSREIAVEWRDRSLHLLAIKSAGVPPWTGFEAVADGSRLVPLPLHIVARDDGAVSSAILGGQAWVATANTLADRAQWYAGFSRIVVPLETWIDLPRTIRDAAFGSGVPILFIGLPRAGQRLDDLDTTILPVAFNARPGAYDAPWPYRGDRTMPVATPMSWVAKPGTASIGGTQCPYLASTAVAAWAADDAALRHPLPAMQRLGKRRWIDPTGSQEPRTAAYVRAGVPTTAALIVSIAGWFLLRRRPRVVIAGAILLIAVAGIAARGRVRPPSGTFTTIARYPLAPGVAGRFETHTLYGRVPLQIQAENIRMSITGDFGRGKDAEVRTAATAPSMGVAHVQGDWDAVNGWIYRREVDRSIGIPSRVVIPTFLDLRGSMRFMAFDPVTAGAFRIESPLAKEADGRWSCAFAFGSAPLPDDASASLRVIYIIGTPATAEVSWAGGTLRIEPATKGPADVPSYVIPPGVLRAIVAQGGVLKFTVDMGHAVPYALFRASLEVQEKKS